MLIPKDSGFSAMKTSTDYFTEDYMEKREKPKN